MNLRTVDLNLFVIFDALIGERSIAGAARKVGLSPSAVSHALGRLRTTFNDPLLVRTPEGMLPTQRARDLSKSVAVALQQLHHGIAQQLDFEAASSDRTFNVRLSDFLIGCLLPRVCARIRCEAPEVTLVVDHLPGDGERAYEPGDIQLRVNARRGIGPEYRRQRIWRDSFVIAMRRGHPALARPMTLERYLDLPHLEVSSAIIDTRPLDEVLASKDLARRAVMTIPSLAGVVPILEHTDLCAILPERWVPLYAGLDTLATAALPIAGIEYAIDMIWHRRDDKDAGHRWLRRLIEQEFAALYAPITDGSERHAGSAPHRLDQVPTIAAAD